MLEPGLQIPIDGFYKKKLKGISYVHQIFPMVKDELETIEFKIIMVSEYEQNHG